MIKIIFYKAKTGDYIDKFIGLYTGGIYSHCELVFNDNLCFSSSPRDKKCRFKYIDINNSHWDVFYLRNVNYDNIFNFCKSQEGKKYDWIGIILSQIIPLNIDDKNKWFCSEICYRALLIGNFPRSYKYDNINPNQLSVCVKDYVYKMGNI